jgi:thiol-disulfide isomerase/thioredoxin/uncharacterized membrane protein YphA (DoxX/SURF4 family)
MNTALLVARVVLAIIFLTAGITKLADRRGSIRAVREFGIPQTLSGPLGTLLPVVEIAVAVALIPLATAKAGAVGAAVLLLGFMTGITVAMAQGNAPDCHCFGQLHSSPAGWKTLVRNTLLFGSALFVAVEGWNSSGTSAVSWLGRLDTPELAGLASGLVMAIAMTWLTWFCFQLWQQNGRILLRLRELEATSKGRGPSQPELFDWERRAQGLPVGTRAPSFDLASVGGGKRSLGSLLADSRPAMLVFADPGCGPCQALFPDLSAWQRRHANRLTIAIISRGDVGRNQAKADEHRVLNVLIQDDYEVATAYKAAGTPSAVLVAADGTVASAVAPGLVAVRQLMERHLGESSPTRIPVHGHQDPVVPTTPPQPDTSRVGTQIPNLTLSDLKDKEFELAEMKGRHSLLLFWNPSCGFCQKMLPDLKAWEADPPEGAPELVLISAGEAEVASQMGLASTVLLDPDGQAMSAFGAHGTPMGVLVDPDLRIASPLAAGAKAVFDLAASLASQDAMTESASGNNGRS